MKLIKCHIENFGKLCNYDVDFQKESGAGTGGLVIINEANGTGKSTLAAFIKVMFFGFANEGKRSQLENERKRYQPWQGGVYGGQLTFSIGEKRYTINRTFGKKEKEDTYVLYDEETKLESRDYTEEIGEELLQIDHDSFLRTVFISQNDCATMSTDSINAKLGNLTEATDDINNYETVYRLLSDQLNGLSPTRKTGQIFKKNYEMGELADSIRKGDNIDKTIQELIQKREEANNRKEQLEDKQAELQKKLQDMSKAKDVAAEKEVYNNICSRLKTREQNLEKERQYFPGRIPQEKELEDWNKEAGQLPARYNSLMSLQLTPDEKNEFQNLENTFTDGIPTPEVIATQRQKVKELSNMRLQLAKEELSEDEQLRLDELSQLFRDEIPKEDVIDDKINAWNKRTEKKNLLNTKRASVDTLRNVTSKKLNEEKARNASEKSNANIILIIGIALLLAGAVSLILQQVAGVVGLIIGVGFIIYSGSWKKRIAKRMRLQADNENYQIDSAEVDRILKEIRADEQLIQKTEQDCRDFFERYELIYEEIAVQNHLNHLRNKVNEYHNLVNRREKYESQELTKEYQELAVDVKAFLTKYNLAAGSEDNYGECIHKLERQIEARENYRQRLQKIKAASAAYEELLETVKGYIRDLSMEPSEKLQEQLDDIRNHYFEYMASEREYKNILEQKKSFEEAHNMEQIQNTASSDGAESMEELNQQLNQLTEQIKEAQETITAYSKPLDKAYEDKERIAEAQAKLSEMEEETQTLKHRYEVMDITRTYLEKAKESFTSRYMNPVMNGFEKYYKLMTGEEASAYQIDANINLTAREYGQQRDTRLLSTGYQNLTGVCMRMALLDAMYRQEKPFVIFDDPFVNLDGDKIEGGLEFLKKISEEYQVIYFTCHDSRVTA